MLPSPIPLYPLYPLHLPRVECLIQTTPRSAPLMGGSNPGEQRVQFKVLLRPGLELGTSQPQRSALPLSYVCGRRRRRRLRHRRVFVLVLVSLIKKKFVGNKNKSR